MALNLLLDEDEDPRSGPIATRAWRILVEQADRRDTLKLAAMLEMVEGVSLRTLLMHLRIMELHCSEEHMPPLPILVEDAVLLDHWSAEPNGDPITTEQLRTRVFEHRWCDIPPPSANAVREFRQEIKLMRWVPRAP